MLLLEIMLGDRVRVTASVTGDRFYLKLRYELSTQFMVVLAILEPRWVSHSILVMRW